MTLGELILGDVRLSARRAHRHFQLGEVAEGLELAARIATLLGSLRESYTTDRPFHQLVREALRAAMPEAFAADLFVHDRGLIEAMEGEGEPLRFVWILHDCGSYLLDARKGQTPSVLASPFTRHCGACHLYLFEGGALARLGGATSALAA